MASVLVVDDDDATRLLVRTLLAHAGHTVFEARNGAEGVALAVAHRPELILFDLSMPVMSGAEFARAIRAEPQTHACTLALYTATPMHAALRDFMEIYRVGAAIPKPSEPIELLQSVERALHPGN
ncbi:MAG: response regulator [Candidatus Baltobacteraceae bacterium]